MRIEQAKSSNPPSSSGLALAKPIIEARGRQSGVPIRRNNFGVYASQYGGDGAPGPQNMGGGLLPPSAYSQPLAQMPFHHMPMQQQQAILHQQQVMQQQQAMLFNQQQAAMQAQQSPAGQPTMNPKISAFFLAAEKTHPRESHESSDGQPSQVNSSVSSSGSTSTLHGTSSNKEATQARKRKPRKPRSGQKQASL